MIIVVIKINLFMAKKIKLVLDLFKSISRFCPFFSTNRRAVTPNVAESIVNILLMFFGI
jgi:hypothetical protein